MIVPTKLRLKNTIKYPTSILIGGLNKLGLEMADSLIKQGGYVVIIDTVTLENITAFDNFADDDLISFLDYTAIPHLEDDIRRVDYVFYFSHEIGNYQGQVSTQEFLTFSNYLDAVLSLSVKFDSRFLLTTSIKANQILYSSESYLGNDFGLGSKLTKVYTEMEIQKYAEGLTMEYHEKVGLNTRICRVGEIIGDGLDLASATPFVKLVTQAINNNNLILTKDGLEAEWFVQIFDAVYAIIKAQFAKDTNGKIFSIAYENTYTHLSIAYKLQEIESDAKEIKFVEDGSNLPPIKIHKPAPNLATIGWMPRVSFDKAVRQSVAAAKIYLMEKSIRQPEKQGMLNTTQQLSFGNKLKRFLKVADDSRLPKIKSETPVDKLLEKKRNEAQEKQTRMNKAGTNIKLKRQRRKLSVLDKLQNNFWSLFIKLANSFSFLKKLSPSQLAIWTVFLSIFLVIYFVLLSPLLVITRAGLLIYPEIESLEKNLESDNLISLTSNVSQLTKNTKDLEASLNHLQKFTKVLSLEDERLKLVNLISYYNIYLNGLQNIDYALEGLREYQNNYSHNLEFVASSASYVVTTSDGLNYDPYLQKMNSRKVYLEAGISDIKKASELLEQADISVLPQSIQSKVSTLNFSLNNFADDADKLASLQNIDDLLGHELPKTYLVLLLDNSKPTPLGGYISAYALFTISNGSVQDIQVKSTTSLIADFSKLSTEDIKLLNQRSYISKPSLNLSLQSLANLTDLENFEEIAKESLSSNFDRDIDMVALINIEGVETLLNSLGSNANESINALSTINADLLTKINNSQTGNETTAAKNELLAQLLGLGINDLFKSLNKENNLIGLFTELLEVKDMQVSSDGLSIRLDEFINSDTSVSIALNLNDSKVINVNRYTQISADLDSTIEQDVIKQTIVLTFPNIGTIQDLSICLPGNTKTSNIKPTLSANTQFTVNTGLVETCIVSQILSETSVGFEWEIPNTLENNLIMKVEKTPGIDMQLNQTIKFIDKQPAANNQGLDLTKGTEQDPLRLVKNLLETDLLEFEF